MLGGLPTHIDNTLYACLTRVDLENLFLERSFRMRFEMGSIPTLVDLDNGGLTLRIIHPYPHSYPLRLIKRGVSMEEGERILVIESI
jgi:hypothetical protein